MRVLIVDDHPIIVAGCAACSPMKAISRSSTPATPKPASPLCHARAGRRRDRHRLARSLRLRTDEAHPALRPQARIVVFSMNDDPIFAARAIETGAKGYVTKMTIPICCCARCAR